MERLKLTMVLTFLLLLTGCTVSDKDVTDEAPGSSEQQVISSQVQPPSESEAPASALTEEAVFEPEIIGPVVCTIEHRVTLYNHTGAVIDEVRLVRGDSSERLVGDLQPGSETPVQWITKEQSPGDLGRWDAPYFMLIVAGREIPIMTARLVDSDIREELYIESDEIAFFRVEDTYYFSPQPDYPDREENPEAHIFHAQYRYLPQVRRWLHQREGQLLFAVGLWEDEIRTYFPDYTEEIPRVTCAAVISCETIYLEDVHLKESPDDYQLFTEIRGSDTLRTFAPDDVIVIPVDHIGGPYLYYRYRDGQGNIRRQYVMDQHRDGNNGGIFNRMLTLDDAYYKLIPVE